MSHPDQILGFDLSEQQRDYWIKPEGQPHKIGRWPKNGSIRADTRYRLFTRQFNFPVATRYLIRFHFEDLPPPGPEPSIDVLFWVDISGGSAERYEGSSALSPTLPRCSFLLTEEDVLPTSSLPGVQLIVTVFWGGTSFDTTYEWIHDGSNEFVNPINTEDDPPDHENGLGPGEGSENRFTQVFGVSECYDFPIDPALPDLTANFNGVDSYIRFVNNIPRLDVPFKISADIRLHTTTGFWPLFGLDGFGGFTGMDDNDTIFGFLRIVTTWVPFLDTWFNWRFEFEQVSQLNYRTFINDVEVDESVFGRQFSHRNTLGVYKHGVAGTIWADMDMKNLKLLTGTVPSSDVALDMPLTVNALDLGPLANHGTTFNMDLPST